MAGILILCVNCNFSREHDIGVHILSFVVTKSHMCSSPIAVINVCCTVLMSSRLSTMICAVGGVVLRRVRVPCLFSPGALVG